jgi:splicing factor 3B subunit 4
VRGQDNKAKTHRLTPLLLPLALLQVARDEATGVSRNFGFVSFDSFESSDAAIEALSNQHLLNRPITVTYAMKKDGKGGERHGTPAERLLAAQARKNNALPEFRPFNFNAPPARPPPPPPMAMSGGLPPQQAIMGAVPPPPGFNAYQTAGQPGNMLPPPPPPPTATNGHPMHYSGPPPTQFYDGPPPQFMTGSNNAPLGSRHT